MQNKIKNTHVPRKLTPAVMYIPANSKPSPVPKHYNTNLISSDEWLNILRYELDSLNSRFLAQAKACDTIAELLEEIETPNKNRTLADLGKAISNECAWFDWNDDEMAADTYKHEIRWLKQTLAKVITHKLTSKK